MSTVASRRGACRSARWSSLAICGPRARKRGAAHSPRPSTLSTPEISSPSCSYPRPRPTPPSCGACPCRPRAGWRVRPEPHGRPPCRRRRGACRPLLLHAQGPLSRTRAGPRPQHRHPASRLVPALTHAGVSVLQPSPGTLRSGACTSSPPLSVSWAAQRHPRRRHAPPTGQLSVEQDGERTRVQ